MSSRPLSALVSVGGSTLVVIGLGAVRMKFVAVATGPTGVGTLGVGMAACGTLATLLGLGLMTSGISGVARARHDSSAQQLLQSALSRAAKALALCAGLIAGGLWLWVGPHDQGQHVYLALSLAVAVASTVGVLRWSATLNGEQQFRRIAASQVGASLVATALVGGAATLMPHAVVVLALAAPPVALLVLSRWASGTMGRAPGRHPIRDQWLALRPLITTGLAASTGTLFMSASQLLASMWVYRAQGSVANGYFQASWTLANLYLAFFLATMMAEYFPRISTLTPSSPDWRHAIDAQIRLSLRVTIPVGVALIAFAPVVLSLVYSTEFVGATELLRWFLVGDAFKCLAWSLSFVLLARHSRRDYILSELSWSVAFLVLVFWLAPMSLTAVGVSYACANALFGVQLVMRTRHRLSRSTVAALIAGLAALAFSAVPTGESAASISVPGAILATVLFAWSAYTLTKERRARAA